MKANEDFEIRFLGNDICTCDCCDSEVKTKPFNMRTNLGKYEEMRLCEVCAGSKTVSGYVIRDHNSVSRNDLLRTMFYCTNLILEAIKSEKKQ